MQGADEAPDCVIPFPYYTWALIHVPCPLLTQPLRRKHLLKVLSLAKVLRALPQNAQSRMTTQVLRVRGATIPAVHYLAAERRTEVHAAGKLPASQPAPDHMHGRAESHPQMSLSLLLLPRAGV